MNIRPVREEDIEDIIQLFRSNYGDDYFLPEFYDPAWVKRGIYSDHIIWLGAEEDGHVVGSGALILNAGDYNDQIGEIGRLVVDPEAGGKGLGGALLTALVDASDDRVDAKRDPGLGDPPEAHGFSVVERVDDEIERGAAPQRPLRAQQVGHHREG